MIVVRLRRVTTQGPCGFKCGWMAQTLQPMKIVITLSFQDAPFQKHKYKFKNPSPLVLCSLQNLETPSEEKLTCNSGIVPLILIISRSKNESFLQVHFPNCLDSNTQRVAWMKIHPLQFDQEYIFFSSLTRYNVIKLS